MMICDDGRVYGVEEFGGSDLSHDLAGLSVQTSSSRGD